MYLEQERQPANESSSCEYSGGFATPTTPIASAGHERIHAIATSNPLHPAVAFSSRHSVDGARGRKRKTGMSLSSRRTLTLNMGETMVYALCAAVLQGAGAGRKIRKHCITDAYDAWYYLTRERVTFAQYTMTYYCSLIFYFTRQASAQHTPSLLPPLSNLISYSRALPYICPSSTHMT